MSETIQIGEITILVTRKDIKNVHLSVLPPDGRVTLTAPSATRLEVARAYATSKLGWIRAQQEKLAKQAVFSQKLSGRFPDFLCRLERDADI